MPKCSTCGFLVRQRYSEFCLSYDEYAREQLQRMDTLEFPDQFIFPDHWVYYCVLQDGDFLKQLHHNTYAVKEVSHSDILSLDHCCPSYTVKVPGVPIQTYVADYLDRRKAVMGGSLSISGGVFVGSQVGGVANKMDTFIKELQISSYASPEEKQLKDALANLRRAIESSIQLKPFEKDSAATDLAMLADQLRKPVNQQDKDAVNHYWARLLRVVSVSADLVTLATPIAKLLGLL